MAVIQVEPASAPPARYKGRVWVRVGPTTQEAGDDDERVLRERTCAGNRPFDRRPVAHASPDDLDLECFEHTYLPSAIDAAVLAKNERTNEERLVTLRFLDDGVPTYGALIAIGNEPLDFVPGAHLQFL